MKETFSTFLPSFPGFYESPLFNSDMDSEYRQLLVDAVCDEAVTSFPARLLHRFFACHRLVGIPVEPELDFSRFAKDAAKVYCAEIARRLNEIGFDETLIEFEKIVSPNFYNFTTDSVNCRITFDAGRAIGYCRNHMDAFREYLVKNYESRSGFISSYSCDPSEWLDRENWGHHEPGSILQFILQNETPEIEIRASERVQELIYPLGYYRMPEAFDAFLESPEAKKIAGEYHRLMKQGDDYLEAMGGTAEYRKIVKDAKEKVLDELVGDMENAMEKAAGLA